MMNQEKGFGARVLKVFSDMDMSFEHLPSGIDTMCVVISQNEIKGREKDILNNITKEVNPDNIEIETNLGLIAVVGRGMIRTPGTAYRIFKAIAAENINVRMIDQGSSELNIIIGVDEQDFNRTIELIYQEFCD
jgi:aspartate kinase